MVKRLLSIMVFVAAMTGGQLLAQSVVAPYEMSFETGEASELAFWTLNPGANATACKDAWEVGTLLHSDGARGLYVTTDSAKTAPCVQFVYRDFQLADGEYYISFDYILPSENGNLIYGVLPHVGATAQTNAMVAINNPLNGVAQLPNVGGLPETLSPTATWATTSRQISVTNPTNGQTRAYRLWFAWVSNAVDTVSTVAAAIDNVQISNAGCARPENLAVDVVSCDSVVFSWSGSSVRYQAQYRKLGGSNWRSRTIREGHTDVVIENMAEGNYDFRVRGICYVEQPDGSTDTIYSPYAFLSNVNIFCPDKHCINYVAITDTAKAICTYGKTNDSYAEEDTLRSAFQHRGVIDFGWDNELSRHTVVWDTLATDERTGNQLRMVPRGETASVRLGNWKYGQECEAITYDFYVDADNSILLIKYAIVLEDPNHEPDANPRFVVQIYDEDGEPLDPICGKVDLNPSDPTNWNRVGSSYNAAVYKDWSTLGLNLDAYAGHRLKVSVATYDCWYTGHYGYAYFTMGCASAHIKNNSCGESASVEVEAPDGFAYTWSNSVNATTYTTQKLNIGPTDPTDWTCTITSLENENCFFQLYVNAEPRYPIAEFEVNYEPKNCENRYVFTNKSYIRVNKNGVTTDHYDEPCDYYTWDFGFDGEESDAVQPGVVIFPEEGGDYQVTLTAMIGDGTGMCREEKTIELHVPALGEVRQRVDTTICVGSYVLFHGDRKSETGMYTFGGPNEKTGCLNIDTLNLVVVPSSTVILDTVTLCYGESFTIDGYTRRESGDIVLKYINAMGCDSNVVQPVHVLDRISPEFTVQNIDEDHEYATILLSGDGFSRYTVDDVVSTQTEFNGLESGLYEFSFYNEFGCRIDTTIVIGQGCIRDVIYQRWNDVLSIKNADHRAARYQAYEFVGFQWYKNLLPIPGAVDSYYFEAGGLDPEAVYSCLLTLADGSQEMSCDFTPVPVAMPVSVSPTYLPGGEVVRVSVPEDAVCELYSTTGLKMLSASLVAGDNYVQVPYQSGIYVLQIKMQDMALPFRLSIAQ